MNEVTACRSVLIEVLTILAKDLNNLAVVGGWVPELAFPDKGHIGSLDVDLALDATKLKPLAYESIRRKLVDSGYQQSLDMPNRFFRTIKGTSFQVKVDLITGEFLDLSAGGTHLQIQELAVWKARGVDLAFAFQQDVLVEGVLPDGGHNSVTAKLPTIAAFLCIKAITLSERMKKKDAYDICFCIDNYSGGYKALADEFRGKLENKLIGEGIAILREKFARLDSIGPVWAAQTVEEATAGTDPDLEMEQRRAYELVNALLRQIDQAN
jgi:hypothetical protein